MNVVLSILVLLGSSLSSQGYILYIPATPATPATPQTPPTPSFGRSPGVVPPDGPPSSQAPSIPLDLGLLPPRTPQAPSIPPRPPLPTPPASPPSSQAPRPPPTPPFDPSQRPQAPSIPRPPIPPASPSSPQAPRTPSGPSPPAPDPNAPQAPSIPRPPIPPASPPSSQVPPPQTSPPFDPSQRPQAPSIPLPPIPPASPSSPQAPRIPILNPLPGVDGSRLPPQVPGASQATFTTSSSPSVSSAPYCGDKYLAWGQWSACSATCGRGYRYRFRKCVRIYPCLKYGYEGKSYGWFPTCHGPHYEKSYCYGKSCCPDVDGKWSHWGCWSKCKRRGFKVRYRACDYPKPQGWGEYCKGSYRHKARCHYGNHFA